MAARCPSRELQRVLCQFSTALYSAFSEWLLILLLLIDAFFLYLATKLYRSYKLHAPCLLCSRFNCLLGNEKEEFYRDLVCHVHKLEISSLAFCHVHKKLADAWEMCETCLLSFAKKRPALEAYKSLLSKVSMDLDDAGQILNTTSDDMVKVPLLKKDHEVGSHTRPCSCCSQPCNIKPCAYGLFQNKPIFKEFAYPDSPSFDARLRARVHLPDRLSKAGEIPSMSLINSPSRVHGSDHLLHFGYRELKFTSESESEVPFSDDDDGSTNIHGSEHIKEESFAQNLKPTLSIPVALKNLSVVLDDIVPERLIHPDPVLSDASASVSKSELHEGGSCDKSFAKSTASLGHGLEEINWSHVEAKPNPPISSKITSEPVPTEISDGEEFSEVDASRSSTSDVEVTKNLNLTDISSNGDKAMRGSDQNQSSGTKGAQPHTTSSENILARESARLHENLKLRLSQLPTALYLESPRASINLSAGKDDEYRLSDTSSSSGLQNVTKRLDSVLSCLESADECAVSEFEGEVAVDRLKRHIENDHKSLSVLYKDLEEERNASAIAANQAMAMINKLQEEKAAMQLEVMQYLRMMEEQTEYEQEALQKLNDQLMEREKEIRHLEAELENYRKLPGGETLAGKVLQPSYESDESEYSTTSTPHVSRTRGRDKHHFTSIMFHDSAWPASGPIRENVLDFEDEREYISECLKRLEKNVLLFSGAGAFRHDEEDDGFNDEIVADDAKWVYREQQHLKENGRTRNSLSHNTAGESCVTRGVNQMEEMVSSVESLSTPIRIQFLEENSISPTQEAESTIEETENDIRLNSSCSYNKLSKTGRRNVVIGLGDEVEHLNARLEALEADRDFLEHTINSLRNGKDGVQFVQEIATHLRELRKVRLTQGEHIFA